MSSRNQNKPPVNVQKTRAVDDAPLDKRRKIGTGRMMASTTASRGRQALAPMSNQKDASIPAPVAPSETEVSECEDITFTKEEVIELLNDKFKGKKFDTKLKQEWMTKHIKKLHDCIKWFQKSLDDLLEEKDNMRTMLNSSETKYLEAEAAMKIKEEELNSTISKLENNILSLKESLANEQSQKQAAIDGHNTEKEVSMALTKDRDSLKEKLFVSEQNLSTANDKVKQQEDMYKRLQEYNTSLQQYNSKLQNELKTATDANKQVEKEKAAILENHSTLRGHYSLLQKEFTSAKDSLDNAVKQKEDATNEVKVLRSELQKLREDRESQLSEIQDLKSEILRYKDNTGRTAAEVHNLSLKSTALEETCSDQSKQISILEHQLAAANQKLKMADLTSSEIRTEYEGQKEMISKLEDQLREKEGQLNEGERLRKKLHNTILELKGNIRVFCRVRPMLSDDAPGADATVCYPTSVELAERGIEIVQNGQITPFTFDKVFKQNASQEDVFMEISQLVQSALDGYKVCIFAYGQTGSGKTYTMMGPEIPKESKGLIPRSLKQIFETSQTLAAQGWEFKMQASMLEIYNETIRDLLLKSNTGDSSSVEVVGGRTKGLTVVDVTSENEVSKLLKRASQSRAVGRTDMNEQSSRSHFVFTLNIDGVNPHTEQRVQGVLNLIDLAGSERLSKSGATGDRLTETKHINKSLSALSEVILALGKKEDHIPYRNSKLTYLLQPCLGGDSKTLMFVNVSPDPLSVNESLCALKFAARVNSCEIGIPRRQTSRPIDSRLSCG
ncbi:kinesin-like protein KIN-14C [Lactuca sativa]|uniref:kinesin-like protein KIN-14C n=1 Tax=Lactuca sativa TaxID=4236 RepID=UPI000CD923E0|nr:kinesin-like protein KIN-14C [Lactuca sativa]